MSNTEKYNRIRPLKIWEILQRETDGDHPMGTEELRAKLTECGIQAQCSPHKGSGWSCFTYEKGDDQIDCRYCRKKGYKAVEKIRFGAVRFYEKYPEFLGKGVDDVIIGDIVGKIDAGKGKGVYKNFHGKDFIKPQSPEKIT